MNILYVFISVCQKLCPHIVQLYYLDKGTKGVGGWGVGGGIDVSDQIHQRERRDVLEGY